MAKQEDVLRSHPAKTVLTVGSACHLSGAPDELISRLKEHLTIDNPKYTDAKKYSRWVGKNFKRKLYFYEMDDAGIVFPRGFAAHATALCRRFLGQNPEIVDNRRVLPESDLVFTGELRSYQREAVNDVLSRHFGVLIASTGSGKTVMALAVIAARRQPALILVHNKELMYQWQTRIREFLGMEAGLLGDGRFDIQPVSVGIVNTVRRKLDTVPQAFGHLIVDECHRVPATLFTDTVTAFDCRYSLGLSATAYRREDGLTQLIYLYMGDRVHEVNPRELEEVGAVLRPHFIQRPTGFSYFFRGDYQALMSALTKDDARNEQIVSDIVREVAAGQGVVLVVSDRVAHCLTLAGMLAARGVEAEVLTGKISGEERGRIVEAVRNGTAGVLIATLQLVGEGFDAAGLTSLFLTTPIKFTGRLQQVIGRILRPAAGKQPRVIDYVDDGVGVLRNSARIRRQVYTV